MSAYFNCFLICTYFLIKQSQLFNKRTVQNNTTASINRRKTTIYELKIKIARIAPRGAGRGTERKRNGKRDRD